MSHTPGPWTWEGDSPSDVRPHVCPHSTEWTDHGPDLWGGDGEPVITSYGYDASGLNVKQDDARLIAAAPDLLEALERIAAFESEAWQGDPAAVIARAAIAKAKGES